MIALVDEPRSPLNRMRVPLIVNTTLAAPRMWPARWNSSETPGAIGMHSWNAAG